MKVRGFSMRWILGVLLIVGFALGTPGDAAVVVDAGPIVTKPAQLTDQEWARMYKRFSGVWLRNERRSSLGTAAGNRPPTMPANVAAELLHYDPQPDGRTILYYQNES